MVRQAAPQQPPHPAMLRGAPAQPRPARSPGGGR